MPASAEGHHGATYAPSDPAPARPTRLHRPTHPRSHRPTRRVIRVPIHRSSHPPPHRPRACQRRLPYPAPPRIPTIPPTCPPLRHPRSTTARPNTRTPCSHPRRPTRRAPSYIPAACSHPTTSTTHDHPLATPSQGWVFCSGAIHRAQALVIAAKVAIQGHAIGPGPSVTPPLHMVERGPGDRPKAHHTWHFPCGFGPSMGEARRKTHPCQVP